jgi:hypothetical protein
LILLPKGVSFMSFRLPQTAFFSLVASSLLLAAGCDGRPPRIRPVKVNSAAAAAEAVKAYDANNDGKISGDEFAQCASFKGIAKDGGVTAEMLTELLDRWQAGNVGRTAMCVRVQHNGKPLANATVKLTPEKFMGKDIKAGVGKSDNTGAATISVPIAKPEEPEGVSLGFYRVEITKDGESIPAKYNTETTLSAAALGESSSYSFNLVY